MESLLFMGDQCMWISWVTLAHKFSSPQSNKLFCIIMQQTGYPQNYVPMNKQNFDKPWTLAPPRIRMIPQYTGIFRVYLIMIPVGQYLYTGCEIHFLHICISYVYYHIDYYIFSCIFIRVLNHIKHFKIICRGSKNLI